MKGVPDPQLVPRVETALLAMPRLQREMFLACRMDNMPYEEIAHRAGHEHPSRAARRALALQAPRADGRAAAQLVDAVVLMEARSVQVASPRLDARLRLWRVVRQQRWKR